MPKQYLAGFEIHIATMGPAGAEPVVLLHSSGLNGFQWMTLSKAIMHDFTVHAIDLIGYGQSPALTPGQSVGYMDDVNVVSEYIHNIMRPVHLVGHSHGGLLDLHVARLNPELFASLTAFEPVAFRVLETLKDQEALEILQHGINVEDFAKLAGKGDHSDWLKKFINWWSGPDAWDKLPDFQKDIFLSVAEKIIAEIKSLMNDDTPLEGYNSLTMPVYLMAAELSPLPARRTVSYLADYLPSAKYTEFTDMGHMAPITHSDIINAEVFRFIWKNRVNQSK